MTTPLPMITDDQMTSAMLTTRGYTVVLLHPVPGAAQEGRDAVIWEHGRRNFALREQGLLSIVCPVRDGGDVAGVGIFNAELDQVREIMDGDPAIVAGLLSYEMHACRSFPGDSLPGI